MNKLLCVLVAIISFCAPALTPALPAVAATPQKPGPSQLDPRAPLPEAASEWARRTFDSMTDDEKIGQLIVPAIVGAFLDKDSDAFKDIARNITEFHVGGY